MSDANTQQIIEQVKRLMAEDRERMKDFFGEQLKEISIQLAEIKGVVNDVRLMNKDIYGKDGFSDRLSIAENNIKQVKSGMKYIWAFIAAEITLLVGLFIQTFFKK